MPVFSVFCLIKHIKYTVYTSFVDNFVRKRETKTSDFLGHRMFLFLVAISFFVRHTFFMWFQIIFIQICLLYNKINTNQLHGLFILFTSNKNKFSCQNQFLCWRSLTSKELLRSKTAKYCQECIANPLSSKLLKPQGY